MGRQDQAGEAGMMARMASEWRRGTVSALVQGLFLMPWLTPVSTTGAWQSPPSGLAQPTSMTRGMRHGSFAGGGMHTGDGRVHFARWCSACRQWSCSDCGQNCGCAPVIVPGAGGPCPPFGGGPGGVQPGFPTPPFSPQLVPVPHSSADLEGGGSPLGDSGAPTPIPEDSTGESPLPSTDARPEQPADPLANVQPPAPLVDGASNAGDTNGPSANDLAGFSADYGSGMGLEGTPNMIGDNFGGNPSASTFRHVIPYQVVALGQTSANIAGDPNAFIAFEVDDDNFNSINDDFFSSGTGRNEVGGAGADTFDITEPIPPSDAPTSPGADFVFDGGTAQNASGTFVDGDRWDVKYSFSRQIRLVIPDPATGGLLVGRLKIAENTSPMPRNRVFMNYSLFTNVPLIAGGTAINRFSPGFERTTRTGQSSFEMRVPFAATIDNHLLADGADQSRNVQWGNMFMAVKHLLASGPQGAISLGLAFTVPTANDLTVGLVDGTPLARIENQAVHLMPFLGWMHLPNERVFTQGFFQIDADANGNAVQVNATGNGLESIGRAEASTFLYVDAGMGYWWYRDTQGRGRVTGIAPTVELHYNRSLDSSDTIVRNGFQIGGGQSDIQQLNGLIGCSIVFAQNLTTTLGYATPMGNGVDQMFDGEFRVLVNRAF